MVSKSSATRTIRLQNDLWSWLAEEAARRQGNVNWLVSELLEAGRTEAVKRAVTVLRANAQMDAAEARGPNIDRRAPKVHVTVPVFERKAFNPQQKKGKK